MNIRISCIVCLSLMFCGAAAMAQDDAAMHSVSDIPGLKKILEQLGYTSELGKSGESEFLSVELKHANGETRKHLLGLDPKAGTIFIIGGGFSWAPDPKKATNEFFRKLLSHNHKIAPNYIFINDFDVFGLTTVIGNVDINAERMRTKIKEHITNFDEKLVPLVKDLPGADKKE